VVAGSTRRDTEDFFFAAQASPRRLLTPWECSSLAEQEWPAESLLSVF
jgi:hypothetical protein